MKNWIQNNYHKLILLVWCMVPLVWFIGKGEAIINGLDTNFPLDPEVWFRRRFFVWNDTINAGIDASSSTSGWFFHLIQYIPFKLGFDLQTTQVISLVFWSTSIVLSSYYFSTAIFSNSKLARLSLTFIYSYNVYLFNTWENVKVANLALVVGIPLLFGLLHRLYNEQIEFTKLLKLLIPVSFLTAGSGINPAYFIALVGVSVIFGIFLALFSKDPRVYFGRLLLIVVVFTLLNLYWIIPLMRYLLFTTAATSLGEIGYTDWLGSLSENTSLLNVIRLQGAWDWYTLDSAGLPIYIPYAVNYFYNAPFILFSFAVPILALLSLIYRDKSKRVLYLAFATIGVLGIFFGAGLHEPTGSVYRVLLKVVPYFSFFRSPWYIFTPYLVISYAVLVGLLVSFLEQKVNRVKIFENHRLLTKLAFYCLMAIFFLGGVLYHYPIFTGKIYRIDRPDSFFVEFPEYVFESKELLSKDQFNKRIITYPDDQIEQFSWGYRGTESILSLFTEEEVIAPSFAFVGESTQPILENFYRHLKIGNYDSAISMMPFLNINTLLIRNDSNSLSRRITDIPETVKNTVGEWDFYTVDHATEKIFSPSGFYINSGDDDTLARLLPLLNEDGIIVSDNDSEVSKISDLNSHAARFNEMKNISLDDNIDSNIHTYEFVVEEAGSYKIAIDKQGVGMSKVSFVSESFSLSGSNVFETDSFYVIENIYMDDGLHRIDIIYPEQNNLLTESNINSAYTLPSIRADELPKDSDIIVAHNPGVEDGVVTKISVEQFNPFNNYIVKFNYKYFYGGVPFVKILQSHVNAPLKIEPIYTGSDSDWTSVSHKFVPVEVDSKLEIAIESPLKQYVNTSKTFIEDLSIRQVYDNKVYVVSEAESEYASNPVIHFRKVSPVKYEVEVTGATENYPLAFLENYSPDWVLIGDHIGTPLHFTANGYANGWYLPANNDTQIFTIYYRNQTFYVWGLILSGLTAVGVIAYGYQKNR